jgi:hypothetical protein
LDRHLLLWTVGPVSSEAGAGDDQDVGLGVRRSRPAEATG